MSNFVRDFSGSAGLKGPVSDLFPVPGSADFTQYADADKWNELRQAAFDLRSWIRTGLAAGTYGNATLIVDADGRITGVSAGTGGGVPTTRVINATAPIRIDGGASADLSADRTLSLASTAVTPGSYTYSSFTVDAQGRLTAASSGAAPAPATRTITTTAPLTIDSGASADLSANRTLAVATFATGASGVVPASGAGTSMLRGDATWRTPTQVKSDLAIAAGDVSGLAATATSTNAANLTGTLAAAQLPAFTGDVTTSAGSVATTIAANAVTNAKAAQMAAHTHKGNNTGSTANAIDLTTTQLKADLAIAAGDVSGLAAIATSGSASDLTTGTLPDGRFPALTGDVTTSAGALATTIAAHVVTYAKQAQAAANTLSGNNTGGTADKTDLTVAQAATLLTGASGIHPHDLGDGSDGTPVFDGVNTFSWATLTGGNTYTLNRSVFWAGATINSGITIKPDGWIIRSSANISNSGDVNTNGQAAVLGTGGNAAWTSSARELPGGVIGASSGNGGSSTNTAPHFISTTAVAGGLAGGSGGGTGGNGNVGGLGHGSSGGGSGGLNPTGAGSAGGQGGPVTLFAPTSANGGNFLEYRCATTGKTTSNSQWGPTSGAGAGANGSAGGVGGGGGGGAGMLVVLAYSISGSGTWRAVGGAAGAGSGSPASNGPGGGAGGTGQMITIHVATGAFPVADVSGGSGGSGLAGVGLNGGGGSGATGGVGYYIKI